MRYGDCNPAVPYEYYGEHRHRLAFPQLPDCRSCGVVGPSLILVPPSALCPHDTILEGLNLDMSPRLKEKDLESLPPAPRQRGPPCCVASQVFCVETLACGKDNTKLKHTALLLRTEYCNLQQDVLVREKKENADYCLLIWLYFWQPSS